VRQEDFGLLFYDTRSAQLTFVRSGDNLVPPPFTGPGRVLRMAPLENAIRPQMERLLESLAARGLIHASEAD
jgi:putative mycofactocin binding protein MftB